MAVAVVTDRRLIGTPTQAGSGTIRVRATNADGSADWTVDYTTTSSGVSISIEAEFSATATFSSSLTSRPPLLSLDDLDTTGRIFDVMALMEASADATPVPSDIYTDPDRGGTDSPLDGELGLGSSNVLISRIRRQINDGLATLTFNDNNNPVTLSIGSYFQSGDGSDLNLTIQTTATNAVDLPHSAFGRGGSGFAHWRLTTEAQAVVDAIEDGDRFIVALWRIESITQNLSSEFEATASFESTLHVTRHLTAEFSASADFSASLSPQVRLASEFSATASFAAELTLSTPIQLTASFEALADFTANQPSASSVIRLRSRFDAQASFQAILGTDRQSVAEPTPGADIIHQLEIASAASVRSISDADDTATFIRIQNDGSVEWQSFIKFDLSGLPNLPIRFASLVLESSMNDGLHIGLFTELHEVSESWTASGLTTWAGRPTIGDQYEQTSAYDDDAFILTSLTQKWMRSPSENYGLRLSQSSEDAIERRFYAYSTIANRRPTLVVLLDDGLHVEYGTVEDHVTELTGNVDLFNSHLLQFGQRADGDHRTAPSFETFGMVYLERTYGRISVDLGRRMANYSASRPPG